MHKATVITTGSANQRPNTPCIRLWIDVIFRGLEDSYCVVLWVTKSHFTDSYAIVLLLSQLPQATYNVCVVCKSVFVKELLGI